MNLQEIKYLIYYGKYDEALDQIQKSDENEIDLLILESIVSMKNGLIRVSLNVAQEALVKSKEANNPIQMLAALIQLISAEIAMHIKSSKELRGILEGFMTKYEVLTNSEQKEAEEWLAYYFHSLGMILFWDFKHKEALDYTLQGYEIRKKLDPPLELFGSLNNICSIHNHLQDVKNLEKYAKELLRVSSDNVIFQGIAFQFLGLVSKAYGNYEESIKHLEKSLEIAKMNNIPFFLVSAYTYLGAVEEYFDNYDIAIKYYHKCAILNEEANDTLDLSRNLYSLIILNIKKGNEKGAEKLLTKMNNLKATHAEIKYRKMLANALFLKTKRRGKHKIEAQNLLEEILNEGIDRPDFVIEAKLHLSELLLDEWKLYGESEILKQVESHIADIYEISQKLERVPLLIDVLLLRSKFAFLQMELDLSSKILEQARLLAEENQVTFKIPMIQQIEDEFKAEIESASTLSRKGYKIQERLDKSKIVKYIEDMQSLIRVGN